MAAGDFSATELLAVQLSLDTMSPGNRQQKENVAEVVAAQAVLANQTASIEVLQNKQKDYEVNVTWVNDCAIVDQACTPDCTITGNELESQGQLYALTLCRESTFSVDLEKFRTNTLTREDVVPKGLNKALQKLDEYYATQTVAKLNANAGYNQYTNGYAWDNAGKTTTIPAASYDRKLAPYFALAASRNRMSNVFMLDDGTLFLDFQNALIDAGNLDGKGDQVRALMQRWYWDFVNFAKASVTDNLFMVDPNAVAIATKARFTSTPTNLPDDVIAMSIPSRNLPGVEYDLYTQTVCVEESGETVYKQSFKVKTRGEILINPNGCPMTVTIGGTPTTVYSNGILGFTKGS